MGDFNRDNRTGGGRSFGGGGRSFGGGGAGGRSFGGGGRSMGRPQMHKATCSQCGNECEIPFKPTGDRPVFCSTCFSAQGGGNAGRPERKSFDRPRFNDRKPNSDDKQMHEAICAKCGNKCEVPFKPMAGKPVYCNQCFEKGGKNTIELKDQLAAVNAKLDKIMKAGAKGAKIMIGGRLNGADISRSQFFAEGKIPLATLRADIDYAPAKAKTTYGILGVKVWIYKGEVAENQDKKPADSLNVGFGV